MNRSTRELLPTPPAPKTTTLHQRERETGRGIDKWPIRTDEWGLAAAAAAVSEREKEEEWDYFMTIQLRLISN